MIAEQFLQVANLLPEAMLLVTAEGEPVAANRASLSRLECNWKDLQGKLLQDCVDNPASQVLLYLRSCSRSRNLIYGSLTFHLSPGNNRAFRIEGARYNPGAPESPIILLRLIPKEDTVSRFVALNQKVEELAQEITRRKQVELKLRAQKEELRTTLASIGDGVIVASSEKKVLSLNPVAEKLTGWPLEEAQGRPFGEVFSITREGTGEPCEDPVEQVLARGLIIGLGNHTLLKSRNGRQIPIEDSAAPIRDEEGAIRGVVIVFRDAIEQRKQEAARQEQMAISAFHRDVGLALTQTDNLDDMLRQCTDAMVQHLRAAFARIWTLDEHEELLKLQVSSGLYTHTDGDHSHIPVGQFKIGQIAKEQKPHLTNEVHGDPRVHNQSWAQKEGMVAFAGYPLVVEKHLVGVMAMFSREPLSEEILNSLGAVANGIASGIERKKAQRALQEQTRLLRESDRRKSEFLAILAHELRNPLAPIRNSAEVMKVYGLPNPELEEAREMIERQSQYMTRLVDDLLDISRIDRGKIELRKERVDPIQIIQQACDTTLSLREKRRHRLTLKLPQQPVQIMADPTRLEQILANLLNNAAKYTDPGGEITLACESEGPDLTICVKDTGQGLTPEELSTIFELFVQVKHHSEQAQGGLGIGLTLVKSLVELHGGTVDARSEGPGMGASFTVRLPLEETPAPTLIDPPVPERSEKETERKILIIDDNVDAAKSLSFLLSLDGHQLATAHNGPDGLEMAQRFHPDVILLDIGLPGMNGYEVARQIRQSETIKDVLLVALTGWGQEEDRKQSKEAGFDHHLVKPVEPDVLTRILNGECSNPQQ